MRFWQLNSICRNYNVITQLEAQLEKSSWGELYQWHLDFDNLVDKQDREKLDYLLPEKLCISVLSLIPKKIYRSDNNLRADKLLSPCKEMTFVEIYKLYGGEVLEDIIEKGSYPLG